MFNDILDDIPPWSVCCTKDVICHAYDTWKLLQSFSFYLRVPLSHARKLTFSHVICRTMGSCPFWIRKLSFYVSQKFLVKLININSPSKIVWSNFVSPGCGGRSKKNGGAICHVFAICIICPPSGHRFRHPCFSYWFFILVTKNCARHFWFYNFFYLATARDSVCILRLLP